MRRCDALPMAHGCLIIPYIFIAAETPSELSGQQGRV